MREPISILSPLPPHNSTCGYCSPPGQRTEEASSYHAAECIPMQLSCRVYQEMIDRGWRRSGVYCYKPDLKRSCCPQYTIKLDTFEFKPSKSQRKLVNRWNRFIIHGGKDDVSMDPDNESSNPGKPKRRGQSGSDNVFHLVSSIHASEASDQDENPAMKFEVTLELSSFTAEKFALYCSYQKDIHRDEDKSPGSFKRFLVDTPLVPQLIEYPTGRPDRLPEHYGSYHQLYRIDGKLVAMGVIDVLPNCISSVYFMYEKEWEKFSFGKLSAMREIALAREIHDAGVPHMRYLYMGFYIHSCPKMRYKGDYAPSYLADPEDYTWFALEKCRPLLDKNHYASFAHPEHCLPTPSSTPGPVPQLPGSVLKDVRYITGVEDGTALVAPVIVSEEWADVTSKETILTTIGALGEKLAQEVLLSIDFGYD